MKKWKITLIIVFVLIAGGTGTLYYLLEEKNYETSDKKVAEIVKSEYEVLLPGDRGLDEKSTAVATPDGPATAKAERTEGSTDGIGAKSGSPTDKLAASIVLNSKPGATTKSKTISTTGSSSTSSTTNEVTAASIINKYLPSFENLQAQADGKLNSLISYAIGEYQSKKAVGEEVSYLYFYSKYTSAASSLEASTDASFNAIYHALTAELEANGFDAGAAKGIKADYNATKKAQRNALMNEAMSRLK